MSVAASPSLFPSHDPPDRLDVGDALGRHYTPVPLADAICASIKSRHGRPSALVEPSYGSGSFVVAFDRHWPDTPITGIDVDPGAPGARLLSRDDRDGPVTHARWAVCADLRAWCAESPPLPVGTCVIGNPPFAEAGDHLEALWRLRPTLIALLLPFAWLGVDQPELGSDRARAAWRGRCAQLSAVAPILGRPWPRNMRETAVYEWLPRWTDRDNPGRTPRTALLDPIRWETA